MTTNTVPAGLENYDPEVHEVGQTFYPKAELLQGLSKKLKPSSGFKGLSLGMIVHSKTGVQLPEDFTPIYFVTRWVEKGPDGKEIFSTLNAQDPKVVGRTEWAGDKDKRIPPAVQPVIEVYGLFGNDLDGGILRVDFTRTSYKAGAALLDMAIKRGQPLWSHSVKLTSKEGKKAYEFVVVDGAPVPENVQKACVELHSKLKDEIV